MVSFQIAFQLLNLNELSLDEGDEFYSDREIIDFVAISHWRGKLKHIWAAISLIGFRRLMCPDKEKIPSVHAIMRYTRLLTMDQGERLVRLMGGMNEIAALSTDERIRPVRDLEQECGL